MKYSNQINMFLAITGCIVVLWVLTQTYLQPSHNEQLDIAGIASNTEDSMSTQPPASYQGENSTKASPVVYGTTSRRPTSRRTSSVSGSVAGGGSLQSGTSNVRNAPATRSPGRSVSRALQSTSPARNASSGPENIPGDENTTPQVQSSSQARPTNVGGFSTPPAGQAMGMEQAKRTPSDSSSDRKYVPFRSSMANRPN